MRGCTWTARRRHPRSVRSMRYDEPRMPFDISTTRSFSAAHQLRLYDGSLEPLHGHNWIVRVTVTADARDAIGAVMDFHELERLVDRAIEPLQNGHLNEPDAVASGNPS